ncbi:hypothetical protein QF021_000246 [Acidovorax delafieldii]|uniref:hypothetical protein n=1 Tax=Acidovorax delafieldii TaxID=47920 RepID=UPI00285E763E|nr:hypothetical protein [Acidovorax delafieldii]MDR6152157.1 hypothetical protein [Acidovorax delafieldii]
MTLRKDTALAHPVEPSKWARIREAERVSYGGAVATPQRMDWRGGDPYKCPELQHRSRGQSVHSIVLGKRVEVR